MLSNTLQFISQTKLRELERQRSLLLADYASLAESLSESEPVAQLHKLYTGLRGVQCVRKQLHPDVSNLEILLNETGPSVEIVEFWQKKLEQELNWGKLRAEIVYVFGALLGEWGRQPEETQRLSNERDEASEKILSALTNPVEKLESDWFTDQPDPFQENVVNLMERIAYEWEAILVNGGSHIHYLSDIQDDIYQSPNLRLEAKKLVDNYILGREFMTAISLSTRDPDTWNWPAEGIPFQVLWTRNKWRMYPRVSLIEKAIVESYSTLIRETAEKSLSDQVRILNRQSRLAKLIELNSPEVILANERRMLEHLQSSVFFDWYEEVDPWDGTEVGEFPEESPQIPNIVTQRADQQVSLRNSTGAYYSGEGYGGTNPQLQLVHAEVQTLRAAYPDWPLFVVKLDLQDYYPSIRHDSLLAMLRQLCFPDVAVRFCERFLSIPLVKDGQMTKVNRGVPMGYTLSGVLAEMLMKFLESHVHNSASVRIIRVVDDITLLACNAEEIQKAYAAVKAFLDGCGLKINFAKSGSLAMGAELPEQTPKGSVRFGLLELLPDANWVVHEESFLEHWQQARQRIESTHSILERVSLYNANLKFLTKMLGINLDLGKVHRDSINNAFRRYHNDFFGTGQSIVSGIRQTITERYLGQSQLTSLPESWVYWPITAGGLSLRNILVQMGQANESFTQTQKGRIETPKERSENWQFEEGWIKYYDQFFESLKLEGPKENPVMKTLVKDFIQRGAEISAGQQSTLSDYWRWVLVVYGPEILERFGTFRFLITDLVPLQLIQERLVHDSSLGSGEE